MKLKFSVVCGVFTKVCFSYSLHSVYNLYSVQCSLTKGHLLYLLKTHVLKIESQTLRYAGMRTISPLWGHHETSFYQTCFLVVRIRDQLREGREITRKVVLFVCFCNQIFHTHLHYRLGWLWKANRRCKIFITFSIKRRKYECSFLIGGCGFGMDIGHCWAIFPNPSVTSLRHFLRWADFCFNRYIT